MSAILDLLRALFIRPEQLSVPMQERRDLAGQLAAVTAERDQIRRELAALRLGLDRMLPGQTESDEERLIAMADLVAELNSWTTDEPQPGEDG